MTITYVIPGATPLNQLSEGTVDGQPDENARNNCVAASLAEGLHILTGATYDGDELKDAVYGQGYTGVMAASAFVAYCAARGVALSEYSATQAELVAAIHREVRAGHPVVVTMPSQWGTAPTDPYHPSGYTHVGCMVGEGAGMLRCMNPWGGFWQDEPDEWWQARLCYGAVWVMQSVGQKAGTQMSGVPSGWTDDGVALRSPNGVGAIRGMRQFILDNAWAASDVLLGGEFDAPQVELSNTGHGAGVVQFSRYSQLSWTAKEGVFRTYLGGEAQYLRSTLAATQAQLSAAQTTIANLQTALAAAQAAEQATSAPPAPPQPTTPPAPVVAPTPPVVASGGVSSPSQGVSIMNIFQKAWQGVSMTPQERALLRLVEGWLWAGLLAALGVVVTLISSGHLVISQQTLTLILGAGFAAIMSAVKKYVSAHGDLLNSLSNPPQS